MISLFAESDEYQLTVLRHSMTDDARTICLFSFNEAERPEHLTIMKRRGNFVCDIQEDWPINLRFVAMGSSSISRLIPALMLQWMMTPKRNLIFSWMTVREVRRWIQLSKLSQPPTIGYLKETMSHAVLPTDWLESGASKTTVPHVAYSARGKNGWNLDASWTEITLPSAINGSRWERGEPETVGNVSSELSGVMNFIELPHSLDNALCP